MLKVNTLKLTMELSSCREAKPARRGVMSKVAGAPGKSRGKADVGDHKGDGSSSSWVPHPRTGIYFPKGQDHVLEDVPEGAASFGQTYWFRTEDGVDKPDPDVSTPY